jgi:hypothetical protein
MSGSLMSRNPLEEYRRKQREIRKEFDAFTAVHCPTCTTPCCVRPSRIAPTDIMLAEAVGWKARVASMESRDLVREAAAQAARALASEFEGVENPPCEHLGERGCTFPKDLRPFGCTTYICPVMYRELDKKTLGRMKRQVKELTAAHQVLMSYIHRSRSGGPAEDADP